MKPLTVLRRPPRPVSNRPDWHRVVSLRSHRRHRIARRTTTGSVKMDRAELSHRGDPEDVTLSLATVSTLNAVRDLSGEARTRWARATATTHVRVKVGVLIIATLAAYHYTLESLLQTVGFDTPLAYIGLVPL